MGFRSPKLRLTLTFVSAFACKQSLQYLHIEQLLIPKKQTSNFRLLFTRNALPLIPIKSFSFPQTHPCKSPTHKAKSPPDLRLPAVAIHRPTGFLSASGGSTRSRLALRSFASVQPVRTSLIAPTPQHWLKAVFPHTHPVKSAGYFQPNSISYNP